MRLPLAALILAFTTSAASAETIAGRAWLVDGDTIEIHGESIHHTASLILSVVDTTEESGRQQLYR